MSSRNPLISTVKSSDTGLRALLHPLVLLTISDYITRHTLRRQKQPIVGALLGRQNGREVGVEHAFEIKIIPNQDSEAQIDKEWFKDRLQQYKDVHKEPPLELVGWWTTCSRDGPSKAMLDIHKTIMDSHNEITDSQNDSALLLTFYPTAILDGDTVGGKLPLTIYESVYEGLKSGAAADVIEMQVDKEDKTGEEELELRFRELPCEVATGEAEMISVDFVARGGGNATAVDASAKKVETAKVPPADGNTKGKLKDKAAASKQSKSKGEDDSSVLSPEDEELISSLATRVNAIRMLQSRISLLRNYLASLPQDSYLVTPPSSSSSSSPPSPQPTTSSPTSTISHPILRSILALTSRLPLLTPPDLSVFTSEVLAEKSDVALVNLLGTLGRNVKDVRELGGKFAIVDGGRAIGRRRELGMGGGGPFGAMGLLGGPGMGMGMGGGWGSGGDADKDGVRGGFEDGYAF